ncbi:hypothetical protein Tco_1235580 [Tanacetum coccineum]
MTGLLLSDTVKNPKLNTNPTSSVHSHLVGDPQSSSNSFKSVNAIQTYFKSNTYDKKGRFQVNTLTGIARDAEANPFKDVLVFRKIVEFLGAISISLKGNMWESEDLIENPIMWDRPPKEGDGAWHIRIELIDPGGEKFNKAFQSILKNRRLSLKENPNDILNLDHFHDF